MRRLLEAVVLLSLPFGLGRLLSSPDAQDVALLVSAGLVAILFITSAWGRKLQHLRFHFAPERAQPRSDAPISFADLRRFPLGTTIAAGGGGGGGGGGPGGGQGGRGGDAIIGGDTGRMDAIRRQLAKLQGDDTPESERRVTMRINQSVMINEQWLEWLHIEVEAVGQRAPSAWVEAYVTGQGPMPIRLMWTGAREVVDLLPKMPIAVPLVIRASERHDEAPIYGVVLPPGEAYVTDIEYLKDRVLQKRILGGNEAHVRFSVIVHYGHGEETKECFLLDLSDRNKGTRMHLHHVVCRDS